MKDDFIPKRDSNLISLVRNFREKLRTYIAELRLDPEEMQEADEMLDDMNDAYREMISKRAEANAATERFKLSKKKGISTLRRLAKLVKNSKNYNPAIGDALGIIGSEIQKKDFVGVKPSISAQFNGEVVLLKFVKDRHEGVKIYSKRGDEPAYNDLDQCTYSPYTDDRKKEIPGKPEQRYYKVRYLYNGKEVGHPSDELKITLP